MAPQGTTVGDGYLIELLGDLMVFDQAGSVELRPGPVRLVVDGSVNGEA